MTYRRVAGTAAAVAVLGGLVVADMGKGMYERVGGASTMREIVHIQVVPAPGRYAPDTGGTIIVEN
jgi:hypothetical protein